MNSISKIMLQTAMLLGSKDEFAVYAANNFINWLKTVVYLSILFVVLNILLKINIILPKPVLFGITIIVIIYCQFFDKKMEKELFNELGSVKKKETAKGFLGILIILLSIALLMFIGHNTVEGYSAPAR